MKNNVKLSEMSLGDAAVLAAMCFLAYQALIYLGWWALVLYVLWAVVLTVYEG
jgi:hypothetical protein